jgi:predicted nucleotidyltransferase
MFTPEDRERLRDVLVSAARADDRIEGAALTGSAALGAEDRWSDIDLALGLAADADLGEVMADWTEVMYRDHGAVHHLDIARRATVYRVYLLASTLQVDLAFSPAAEFGAIASTFRLIFGTPAEQPPSPPPGGAELVGLGWLYALHARSSIARCTNSPRIDIRPEAGACWQVGPARFPIWTDMGAAWRTLVLCSSGRRRSTRTIPRSGWMTWCSATVSCARRPGG